MDGDELLDLLRHRNIQLAIVDAAADAQALPSALLSGRRSASGRSGRPWRACVCARISLANSTPRPPSPPVIEIDAVLLERDRGAFAGVARFACQIGAPDGTLVV